jgi:rhodanese-related sulfurtransferase
LKKSYIGAILSPVVVLIFISIIPDKDTIILNKISRAKEQKKCVFHEISADKLAYEITNNYYKINIIDVRTPEEFNNYHLPLAINIPFSEIMNREWESYFKQNLKSNVFYANSDTLVRMACLKAKYIGKSQNLVLTESADEFKSMFFEPSPPPSDTTKDILDLYNFRVQSAIKMNDIVNSLQNINKPVQKEIRKVKGGCS